MLRGLLLVAYKLDLSNKVRLARDRLSDQRAALIFRNYGFVLQLLGDILDEVFDRRDIILFLVTRGVITLVENGA